MPADNPARITGVDFVHLPTENLEAAMEFYGTVLELPRSMHREGMFAEYETGNLTLAVLDSASVGLTFAASRNPIALHVADVAAARAALESRGVTFQGDTFDTSVCQMAFFADPDGNALMLHHRYAPRHSELAR